MVEQVLIIKEINQTNLKWTADINATMQIKLKRVHGLLVVLHMVGTNKYIWYMHAMEAISVQYQNVWQILAMKHSKYDPQSQDMSHISVKYGEILSGCVSKFRKLKKAT